MATKRADDVTYWTVFLLILAGAAVVGFWAKMGERERRNVFPS